MTARPPVKERASPAGFASNWDQYIEILEAVGRRQLRRNESASFRQSFLPLYNDVFEAVRSAEIHDDVMAAVTKALEDPSNELPLMLLMQELEAYKNWQAPTVMADAADTYRLDIKDDTQLSSEPGETSHALDAGKTIKDSLESLLGKWMKGKVRKVLGIVNELLSIVRGGA